MHFVYTYIYVLHYFLSDVDECATGWNDCGVSQRCENIVGSYTCKRRISCGTGYTLQGSSQVCVGEVLYNIINII